MIDQILSAVSHYGLIYAMQCELAHGLLSVVSGLPLLAAYSLTQYRMASFLPKGQDTKHYSSLGFLSLLLACFGLGLVGHYIADMILLPPGLWKW